MWIDDQVIRQCDQVNTLKIWIPESVSVVLGSSNQAETECFVSVCEEDHIPILKRRGGGGTVVLYPGCLIISYGAWVKEYYDNKRYFCLLNKGVIEVLESVFNSNLFEQKGLSDITFGEKKIAGTSLFRSRNYLLYQASLLVDRNVHLIDRYLQHPSREPDYRQGKSHKDFLIGLSECFTDEAKVFDLQSKFLLNLPCVYKDLLKEDFLKEPPEDQVIYLKNQISDEKT